jgi:hypothetical protein
LSHFGHFLSRRAGRGWNARRTLIFAAYRGETGATCFALVLDQNPILSDLWQYWQRKRAGRPMPSRADIEPMEIPVVLPYVLLVERSEDGRFRYRLAGTAVVDAYGMELTGRYVDEVFPPGRRVLAEQHYAMVYQSGRPISALNRYTNSRGVEHIASRLILPLAGKASSHPVVQFLLIGQTCTYDRILPNGLGIDSVIDAVHDQVRFLDEPAAVTAPC